MLRPLRCCSACLSSGPSRLTPAAHRRAIPRAAYNVLYVQYRLKTTDARRQRRAAIRSEKVPEEDQPSRSVPIDLTGSDKIPLSLNAIRSLRHTSPGRPRSEKSEQLKSDEIASSTTEKSSVKSKLYKWLKWPLSGSTSGSSSASSSSTTSTTKQTSPDEPADDLPPPRGSNTKSSKAVFKELMQGALLTSDPEAARRLQKEDQQRERDSEAEAESESEEVDEPTRARQLEILAQVAAEHEAGIESYQMTENVKKGRIKVQHGKMSGKEIEITEVKPVREIPVATLKRGLSRVLFNPSVHFTRDPRSHVYNFDTSLETIPQADEFAYHRLPQYITASEDEDLYELVKRSGMRFYGSTSTLTKALSQIYFHISGGRTVSLDKLSQAFANERNDFPAGAKLPAMLWVKAMPEGKYAVDNDKRWDIDENILSDLGRVMEKMVTSDEKELKRFMLSSPESGVSEEERNAREAYRYCKGSNILMRSQLDCYDERLPGSGTFDIKTRAAMVIRHDRANYEENSAYDVYKLTGLENSFEKEFYDMCRSAFLKYSMQVRIGGMDGIFVAYHNTARIFGYQYVSLAEMDEILHGCAAMGDQAFKLSVSLLEKLLDESTALHPKETINLVVDSNQGGDLLAFVTPKTDDPIEIAPVVRLKISVINKLNGTKVTGPVDFESVSPNKPSSVNWTIEYEIEKTTMDEEGYTFARKGLQAARKRYTNMTSLNLPTGKTAQDMNPVVEEVEEVVVAEDGETTPDSTDVKDKAEKMAVLKWKNPDGRILALRRLARQSGKDYEKRISETKGKKDVVWTP